VLTWIVIFSSIWLIAVIFAWRNGWGPWSLLVMALAIASSIFQTTPGDILAVIFCLALALMAVAIQHPRYRREMKEIEKWQAVQKAERMAALDAAVKARWGIASTQAGQRNLQQSMPPLQGPRPL